MTNQSESKGYVENEDHVPNPTDMRGTLATSGGSGHMDQNAVSDIYREDRRKVAQAIADDEAHIIPDPNSEATAAEQEDQIKEDAQALLDSGELDAGGKSEAQAEAAKDADDKGDKKSGASKKRGK